MKYKTSQRKVTKIASAWHKFYNLHEIMFSKQCRNPGGAGGLPYVGYVRMCSCEGCGFQAVYSGMGYINQRVWV